MTTPLPWPAGQTPYVTADQLYSAAGASSWPLGIQFSTIPAMSQGKADYPQQYAVISTLCMLGSARVDEILNQAIRCQETTEEQSGPDFRVTMQYSSGNGRFIAARWPVTQVLSMQVSPANAWPRQWTSLPAGNFEPERPVDGLYGASAPSANAGGQGILFAPGYGGWCPSPGFGWPGGSLAGRNNYRYAATYLAGYPHTCLTSPGTVSAGSIVVDDCAGWLLTGTNGQGVGAAGIVYDAVGGGQEAITVTAVSATTGPGTLTLASPLNYAHDAGIAVSAMPQSILWGSALCTGAAALRRGATATTVPTTSGRQQVTEAGLEAEARRIINTFRRTI